MTRTLLLLFPTATPRPRPTLGSSLYSQNIEHIGLELRCLMLSLELRPVTLADSIHGPKAMVGLHVLSRFWAAVPATQLHSRLIPGRRAPLLVRASNSMRRICDSR